MYSELRMLVTLACFALVFQRSSASAAPTIRIDESLAPPSALLALPCGNQVELRWRDNSTRESGFVVYRRPSGSPTFVAIGTSAPNEARFLDTNLSNGAYAYRVAARDGSGLESRRSRPVQVQFPNQPPVITTDLPPVITADASAHFRFHVTVTDPDGDAVDLELLNPPLGVIFDPVRAASSPVTVEGRWQLGQAVETPERLVFASCSVRKTVAIRLEDAHGAGPRPWIGDVTGDGSPDAIVWNPDAVFQTGGPIGVYSSGSVGTGVPLAVLDVAGDALRPRGPALTSPFVQLADVSGDGILDVVSCSLSQRIYVWAGGAGLSGSPAPTAVLAPGAPFGIAGSNGAAVQLVDVDGDEVLDVVSGDIAADLGAEDTGAIFFWLGGAALSGSVAPTRTLSVPAANAHAELGGTRIADVTGDGVLDFLASARVAGVSSYAAAHVWSGAAVLGGASAPTIDLHPTVTPTRNFGVMLADLTGDGVMDVVSSDSDAAFDGQPSVGVIQLWSLSGASGSVDPVATLAVPGAHAFDSMAAVRCADLSGDGILDLVAGAESADVGGALDNGALYLWRGGSLSGFVPPSATLSVPGSVSFDRLSRFPWLDDWNQDGILDLFSVTFAADIGGVVDAGAVYVWNGGALSGAVAPSATLRTASPAADDLLGGGPLALQLSDVTGDGLLDAFVSAPRADEGGIPDCGAIYLWSGADFSGTTLPIATLRVPTSATLLGEPSGYFLADLDGDAALDVLAGTPSGQLFSWRGGSWSGTRPPTARLSGGPALGHVGNGGIGLFDLSQDGILDVVAISSSATIGGVPSAGALYLWRGGAWPAVVPPSATLVVSGALANDALGSDLLRVADLDLDGKPDVLSGSRYASVGSSYGATYVWSAPGLASGLTSASARFAP